MEIEAAVIREHGRFEIVTVDLDDLRPGEVRVKIAAVGICHTDLGVLDGHIPWKLPAIVGHEGAGVVEAVGEGVSKVVPGDHVVMSFASCGHCARCEQGEVAYCDSFVPLNFLGSRADGSATHRLSGEPVSAPFFYQSSFATHAIASERNVVKVAHDLPFELVAPLGCGVQTGAGAVLNRLKPEPGSTIVLFGMGAVGLSAVLAASHCRCSTIVAVDLVDSRLDLAREFGATHVVRGDAPDLVEQIRKIATGGFDYAVEATGRPDVMVTATQLLRKAGQVVLLGVAGGRQIPFGADILRGITIHTSIEGDSDPEIMIPALIDLYRNGKFPFDRMIQTFAFADINEAVSSSRDGTAVKPVLLMGEG